MAAIPDRSGLRAFAALPRSQRLDPVGGILAMATAGLASAAAIAGLTLLLRRLVGGFAAGPTAASGWLVAAGGLALIAAVDAAGSGQWPRWLVRGGLLTAALAVNPLGWPLSWMGHLTSWAAFFVAAVAIVLPSAGPARPRQRRAPQARSRQPVAARQSLGSPAADVAPPLSEPLLAAAVTEAVPTGFRQRTERYDTETGIDCLRGRAILSVAVGSRTGFAHVGFCPSFAATPTVEVTTDYDGVEAEFLIAETLPWGIRLECRLAEPAEEPLDIPVDFEARYRPPHQSGPL